MRWPLRFQPPTPLRLTPLLAAVVLSTGAAIAVFFLAQDVVTRTLLDGSVEVRSMCKRGSSVCAWQRTYTRGHSPLLFWLHLMSWVAMFLMPALMAAIAWLLLVLRVTIGPMATPSGNLKTFGLCLANAFGFSALYFGSVFFGLRLVGPLL